MVTMDGAFNFNHKRYLRFENQLVYIAVKPQVDFMNRIVNIAALWMRV